MDVETRLQQVATVINQIDDPKVPRNIRRQAKEACEQWLLNKAKKLLNLSKEYQKHNNVELTISSAKPPIFWKDKEITKQQIYKWRPEKIEKLIYKLNELEYLIKKNVNLAINLITDFILDKKFVN